MRVLLKKGGESRMPRERPHPNEKGGKEARSL